MLNKRVVVSNVRSIPALDTYPDSAEQFAPTVVVRQVEEKDCESLQQLFREPQIIYWTAELPYTSTDQIRDQVLSDGRDRYTLVACTGEQVVGMLGFSNLPTPRVRHIARLGPLAVHPNWQGQGIGSSLMQAAIDLADNWLNLHRLDLLVYTDNGGAIALYKKFGFKIEGTLHHMAFRAGKYVDGYLMARLNDGGGSIQEIAGSGVAAPGMPPPVG